LELFEDVKKQHHQQLQQGKGVEQKQMNIKLKNL